MTPEAQRIAIAEACGNKPHTPGAHGVLRWIMEDHEPTDIGDGVLYLDDLPDYLNDLNAMHEAEKVLDRDIADPKCLRYRYAHLLYFACVNTQQPEPMRATAAQRAEAFLRTIGRWENTAAKEDKP